LGDKSKPSAIIENLYPKKPSFRPSKWPQKLKTAKNSKLPKLPENCFEPVGKGGWPPISTWIIYLLVVRLWLRKLSLIPNVGNNERGGGESILPFKTNSN
jgi:hypothetical protein